jgi:serine/threonine-protein kinase
MVTANRLKILDFGIASMRGLGARLTQVGMVLGSPMYMSPEQIRGRELDGRSDFYSLGLIAYTLIAGRDPFEANEPTVLVLQKLREDPPNVRTFRPDTPEAWSAFLARLLAREREDRFASARELLDALARLPG